MAKKKENRDLLLLSDVVEEVGVHPATIRRWMAEKRVAVTKKKNARGWYVFTRQDITKLKEYRDSVTEVGEE